MDLSLKVDTLDTIDQRTFVENYLKQQKPFVLKGLASGTAAGKKWDLDYMKFVLGNVEVDVFNNQIKSDTAYTRGNQKMIFSDFIEMIRKPEPTHIRLFLFNGFKHAPKLRNEFPCPIFYKGILDKIGFMFFGGKSTDVRMHYDIDMSNVLHTQFAGKKRVILLSPENGVLLYKLPFNTFTLIDASNPNFDKYPALKYVKGYDITLNDGDTLFMPSGFWHYMIYQEGGFAVTYRKIAQSPKLVCDGVMNLTLRLWFDKIMSAMLKSKWSNYKVKLAIHRANAEIERLENL